MKRIRWVYAFFNGICPKMSEIAWLEFELAVQHVCDYPMGTPYNYRRIEFRTEKGTIVVKNKENKKEKQPKE